MCQKAFGSIGGLLVSVIGLVWTRGEPRHFQSSNVVQRGFCHDCGTPLTFETSGSIDISIAAFDNPNEIRPVIQLDRESRISWFDELHVLPEPSSDERAGKGQHYASIVSRQHPDHDTDDWGAAR